MKQLNDSDYKQIIERRDPRYDGRFYCGVITTMIYCRPVCPARPKFKNIIIYKSPSAAEKAGYRACLRCRPDLAPGCKSIDTGKNIVSKTLSLVEENTGGNQSVEMLARTLGLSSRHLRRMFDEYLGASPIEIIQTQRLHLAKQLIQETEKPIGEIAFATGFNSIRRFNEAFKTSYRVPPSEFRKKQNHTTQKKDEIILNILVRKPYDLNSVLSYLKRHAACGVEKVENQSYERYVPNKESYSTVNVTINKAQDALQLNLKGFELNQICMVLVKIKRLFDVDHNPAHLPESLPESQAGIRVPGSFDPFEVAVSIILGQLISIKQASKKLSALIQQFGTSIDGDGIYRFPSPATLMDAEIERIGITKTKANAIRSLSAMVHTETLHFTYSSDLKETRQCLLSIKGIGPWTTEMIMMRCFNDADAFPESDLIVKRALEQKLVDEPQWQTNHSYLTHYIWNKFAKTLSKKKEIMTICYQKISSPVGSIFIAADDNYLRAITFDRNEEKIRKSLSGFKHANNEILKQTQTQLQEYFAGERIEFDLPVTFTGTDFQQQTWRALLTIPYGETRSYSEQALLIGNPKAVRAVGRTNGLNPIGIVVPCHRVIGKSGKLTGYAGGLDKKRFLLELERKNKKG